MTERRRKLLRIAGLTLVAAALCIIGVAVYNMISSDIDTQNSLLSAEQLIEANQIINDMDAYTGDPQQTLSPQSGDATTGPDDQAPADTAIAPDGGDGASADPDKTDAAGGKPTAKPKSDGGSGGGTKTTVLGILIFDSLGGRKVPVLEGASASELSRGAAHHPHSSPLGSVGNCVIFGHRDTVFRGFGRLSVGDTIRLQVPGKTYTYRISTMSIVDPDDSRMFQAYGQAVMTLVTCYPFNYVGSAPQRYIVVAVLQ